MFMGNTESSHLLLSWIKVVQPGISVFIRLLTWCLCTLEFDLSIEQKLLPLASSKNNHGLRMELSGYGTETLHARVRTRIHARTHAPCFSLYILTHV